MSVVQVGGSLVLYLVLQAGGRGAVQGDELLQVLLQAGLGGLALRGLGPPQVGPQLGLTAQQAVARVTPGGGGGGV